MATQNATKAQPCASAQTLIRPADAPAPTWVNGDDPSLKMLLDASYYKENSQSLHASDAKAYQSFALQDAMGRVAVKMAEYPRRDATFADLEDELARLVSLRFGDFDEFKDYTADVISSVAEDAYQAGLEAGEKAAVAKLEARASEPSNLHSSEIAAIAVSDHDCPGAHKPTQPQHGPC